MGQAQSAPPPAVPVFESGNLELLGFPAWATMAVLYCTIHMVCYAAIKVGMAPSTSEAEPAKKKAAATAKKIATYAMKAGLDKGKAIPAWSANLALDSDVSAALTKVSKVSDFAMQVNADPHMAAHFVPQLIGFIILAYLGAGAWLLHMPESDPGPGTYIYYGERIAMHMGAFQIYELAAAIPAPVRHAANLSHARSPPSCVALNHIYYVPPLT